MIDLKGLNVLNVQLGTITSAVADTEQAVGFVIQTKNELTKPNAKLISFRNGEQEVSYIDIAGNVHSKLQSLVEPTQNEELWIPTTVLMQVLTFDGKEFSPITVTRLFPNGFNSQDITLLNDSLDMSYTQQELEILVEKTNAINTINQVAGTIRKLKTTDIFNQSEILREKLEEAIDYLSQTEPSVENFPFIRAHCNATGDSPETVANLFIARRKYWVSVNVKIEEIRERGIFLLNGDNLVNVADINDTLNDIIDQLHSV
jgi:hypothetical protein